jgi:hypothetical protein
MQSQLLLSLRQPVEMPAQLAKEDEEEAVVLDAEHLDEDGSRSLYGLVDHAQGLACRRCCRRGEDPTAERADALIVEPTVAKSASHDRWRKQTILSHFFATRLQTHPQPWPGRSVRD